MSRKPRRAIFERIRAHASTAGNSEADHHHKLAAMTEFAIYSDGDLELVKHAGRLTAWLGDLLDGVSPVTIQARLDAILDKEES